jgi:hypothetical protein
MKNKTEAREVWIPMVDDKYLGINFATANEAHNYARACRGNEISIGATLFVPRDHADQREAELTIICKELMAMFKNYSCPYCLDQQREQGYPRCLEYKSCEALATATAKLEALGIKEGVER